MTPITLNLDTASHSIHPPAAKGARRNLLTPLPEPGHFLLVIDNSSLNEWKACPTKAQYHLVWGRQGHAKDAALVFGGAVHAGMETLLRGKVYVEGGQAMDDSDVTTREETELEFTSRINQSILTFFTENPSPPDEWRTPTAAIEVLGHYRDWARYPGNEWEIQEDEGGLLIERAFELPLGVLEVNARINMPWLSKEEQCKQVGSWAAESQGNEVYVSHIHVAWSGRIDAIARCNNLIRVIDHKTGQFDDQNYIKSFMLASQTRGYLWAARQLYPHLDIHGFCLNAIRLKKPAASGSIGMLDRGPRGGEPRLKFYRAFYEYTPEQLTEWADDTLCDIEDFIHCLIRGRFTHNDKSCFNFFRPCEYFDVCCESDLRIRANMLNSDMFKDVTWNPTEGR